MSGSALISSIPDVHKTVPVHRNGNRLVNGSGTDSLEGMNPLKYRRSLNLAV